MRYGFLLLICCFLTSCEKELDSAFKEKSQKQWKQCRSFYPLAIGNAWTYQIDSVYFSRQQNKINRDTITGIYRDSIADKSVDQVGRTVYRLLHQRIDENTNWLTMDVFTISDDSLYLLNTTQNIPIVELIFPFSKFDKWNPYSFTDKNKDFLVKGRRIQLYSNFSDAFITDSVATTVLGNTIPVITVSDGDFDDQLIIRQYSSRKYAAGIGLIYKEQEFYTDQTTLDTSVSWQDKAEAGFKLKMTLLKYNVH